MKRTTSKTGSKTNNKKIRFIINPKSRIIFEDRHKNSEVKVISDKKEPFFKYEEKED